MAPSQRIVFAAIAYAAARQVSAQLAPLSNGAPIGEGVSPSSSRGNGGTDGQGVGASVTETVTTKNIMGGPLTLVYTYPVSMGSEVIKTTNLLGQSTTLYLPLDPTRTPAPTTVPSPTSDDQGAYTTYISTDQYGQVHTVTGPASLAPTSTPTPPQQSTEPSSSAPDTTPPPNGAAAATSPPSPSPTSSSQGGGISSGAIAAAVVVPVLAIAAIGVLVFFLMRRRRRQNAQRSADERYIGAMEGATDMRDRTREFSTRGTGTAAPVTGATATTAPRRSQDASRQAPTSSSVPATGSAPPAITGTPSQWRSEHEGDSGLSSSYSSAASDPFRDPTVLASHTVDPPSPIPQSPRSSTHMQPQPPSPAPLQPTIYARPARTEQGVRYPASPEADTTISPPSTPGDSRANTMDRAVGEVEEAEIMEGQVARVGRAQRASMVKTKPPSPKDTRGPSS